MIVRDMHHSQPSSKASPNYLQSLRPPERASMTTPAQEIEERPAKMRRIHRSPGPLPGVFDMLSCQVHQLVPWTRSRTGICRFGFWIVADLGNVCSHLQLLQTNKFQGEIHCRVESQKRGTPHLHCVCWQSVLHLPPRDGECPDVRPIRLQCADPTYGLPTTGA